MKNIGHYQCIKTIGKGGMGEVLLAYDPICDRNVAIKRIRPDLKQHSTLKNRFIREAKVTAQLTHPGIISIYSIHMMEEETYYTMPFIEGETLKQIIKNQINRKSKPASIASLLPAFKSICQTIGYAHSKGILHRDLKPENILVGTFGEVIVLDWGLAQMLSEPPIEMEDLEIETKDPDITRPGKLVGTVAYMAPERALGSAASIQTDIYALGVILYQILTLQLPFHRGSIQQFRTSYKQEKLVDPQEAAPYRDVPPRLSSIVKKCLDADPSKRYGSMEALIHDIVSHMEGRSEWFESARLNVTNKKDWEFQENVLISKHVAITRTTEAAEWVSIMVSKASFSENTKLQTRIFLGETSAGIGLLLCIPEAAERENPLEGYCLWIGSSMAPGVHLLRNTVQVMHFPEVYLKKDEWHALIIEKVDNNIYFYLDGSHIFTYLSYLPLSGTHVGMLSRDADFTIDEMILSTGSQNLTVSCLAIPDAFLASKDYKRALAEYRRIGYSFPGHAEGREGLFRAGITLLEQAKTAKLEKKGEDFYVLALEEFAKLHDSSGAPLEYLGKALVYQALKDVSEEIKCLELGLRRYYRHPLVSALKEQIIYRMHEFTQSNRRAAYQLILIVLRLLPEVVQSSDFKRLFKHLSFNWEPLFFLESPIDPSLLGTEKINEIRFAIPITFWLAAPFIFVELFHELIKIAPLDLAALGDILYSLFELGSYDLAHNLMEQARELIPTLELPIGTELKELLALLEPIYICQTQSLDAAIEAFFSLKKVDVGVREFRTVSYLQQFALRTDQDEKVEEIAQKLIDLPLAREDRIYLDSYRIWAFLKMNNQTAVADIFESYPLELLNQEGTPLHPLFGCYLYLTEGEEIANVYFSGVIDTPFPRSYALLGHELANKISEAPWYSTSFLWERRRLYQQLTLYCHCSHQPELEAYYRYLEKEEYINVRE